MSEHVEKLRLADRTEAILRSDRTALRKKTRRQPAVLLTLVPDIGHVIDFMDAYMPDIAESVGLEYIRLLGSENGTIPAQLLERVSLTLADVTDQDRDVLALVRQVLSEGRRTLLAAQSPADIPFELRHLQHVLYSLQTNDFEALLRAVRDAACGALAEQEQLA